MTAELINSKNDCPSRNSLINKRLALEISFQDGIRIRSLTNLLTPDPVVYSERSEGNELFFLKKGETICPSKEFIFADPVLVRDETEELLTVSAHHPVLGIRIRVCFLNNLEDTISILFQMAEDTAEDSRDNYTLHSPFLSNLRLGNPKGQKYYFPSNPVSKKSGSSAVSLYSCAHLPLVITDPNDEAGFAVSFPTLSDLGPAVQNRNVELWNLSSMEELQNHSLILRPGRTLADMFEISICGLKHGWREAFARTRKAFREKLDLRQYERPELQWFHNTLLHHFTFLYTREAYDYKTQKPDIDRICQDGDEFGGYDTLTFWHQYPQLGVDERTQWDFFRDFPGGIKGLNAAVAAAHTHGIKVLLPYKPWDIPDSQSMEDVGRQITGLLADTDADGFFLDTMDQAPSKFRKSADSVKPEAVFCSEQHPSNLNALSLLTASWDQIDAAGCMPETDLLRFLLPEHTSPQISRWSIGTDKDALINRAIFSGAGLVIWQDIFGTWLPYSPEQKARIRDYKKIWSEHRSCFQSPEPIPFYPVKQEHIYCSYFPDEQNREAIFTFYNDNSQEITGALTFLENPQFHRCRCLLGNAQFSIENGLVTGRLPAGETVVCLLAAD